MNTTACDEGCCVLCGAPRGCHDVALFAGGRVQALPQTWPSDHSHKTAEKVIPVADPMEAGALTGEPATTVSISVMIISYGSTK